MWWHRSIQCHFGETVPGMVEDGDDSMLFVAHGWGAHRRSGSCTFAPNSHTWYLVSGMQHTIICYMCGCHCRCQKINWMITWWAPTTGASNWQYTAACWYWLAQALRCRHHRSCSYFTLYACCADNELQHLHTNCPQKGTKRQGHCTVQGIAHGVIATTTTTSIHVTGFIFQLDFCQIMEPPVPIDSSKFAVVKGI